MGIHSSEYMLFHLSVPLIANAIYPSAVRIQPRYRSRKQPCRTTVPTKPTASRSPPGTTASVDNPMQAAQQQPSTAVGHRNPLRWQHLAQQAAI